MFRNPPETNFRALRDMGLAAWWGSALMNLAALVPAAATKDDPAEQLRIHDAGMKGSRGLQAGAVTAYLVGTSLTRFGGSPFGDNGVPRWMTEGVESKPRTVATALALGAAIGSRKVREQAMDAATGVRGSKDEAEALRKKAHTLSAVVPALTGYLLYSHLKQDMRETQQPLKRRALGGLFS